MRRNAAVYVRGKVRHPDHKTVRLWSRLRPRGGEQFIQAVRLRLRVPEVVHVTPRAQGGESRWENCVLACNRIRALHLVFSSTTAH